MTANSIPPSDPEAHVHPPKITIPLGTNAVPYFDYQAVLERVSPSRAIETVRWGFVRYAKGDWTMPPKVYLFSPPFGDFRAMPALGDGLAVVKWVSSFPRNHSLRLPSVVGLVCVNNAETGEAIALVDGNAVTALRTGASAAIASETLAAPDARSVGIIGCGAHGSWAARCLNAAGYGPGVCNDQNTVAAEKLASELDWISGSREQALECDIVTTVTPGASPVIKEADIRPGMHINGLGADGPDKAELEPQVLKRSRLFCDQWDQASHGGEISDAVTSGAVARGDVIELGAVLTDAQLGRRSDEEITFFDSTGLAIQDLALVHVLLESHGEP